MSEHSHYDHYDADQIRRLDGFFGRVNDRFNRVIAEQAVGPRVLDFGCGFGSLVDHLRQAGLEAVGVDLLPSQVTAGRARYPDADLRVVGTELPFPARSFDTVVFKESLHHVFAESADPLGEAARVCARRIVVFDPNPSLPLKVGRTLIGHVDPTLPPADARRLLEGAGFRCAPTRYLAALAFPLSGGFVGRPLLPHSAPDLIFLADELLVRALGRHVAWRYLIVADRPTAG